MVLENPEFIRDRESRALKIRTMVLYAASGSWLKEAVYAKSST